MSSSTSGSKNPQADQKPYQPTPASSGHGKEPSGPKGDDPSTAGPGPTEVKSKTPENRLGHINPSAPEDANVTPGSMKDK
jgi:hypothetical protein